MIDHIFGAGGGTFTGSLAVNQLGVSDSTDDGWLVFGANAGDNLTLNFSVQNGIGFYNAILLKESTNGIVEVGDVAGITNFNNDHLGDGQDLVMQTLEDTFFFQDATGALLFNVLMTGQYAIGIKWENDNASSTTAQYRVDLSGNTGSIISPVPLPAALPLFGTGLGILGFLGWRRRRQAQAV